MQKNVMFLLIDPNSRTRKGEKKRVEVKGEYGRILGAEERNADNGGMVPPSQQHVVSCVKEDEWGSGTRGLRIVAAFWAGISFSSA